MNGETHPADSRQLQEEISRLQMENKKLARLLNLANSTIERNRVRLDAQDSLHDIVLTQKSELEKYMNLLLENCPDIILLFDKEGRLVYCAKVFLEAIGVPAFGMISNMFYRDLLAPMVSEAFLAGADESYRRIFAGERLLSLTASLDFGKTGSPRSYSIQLTPMLGEGGETEGAIAIFHDTTEILKAQRDAERANAAKSDFLATVSHEIRTPMNAIIGLSDMLKESELTEVQMGHLNNIQKSSFVLLDLINDVLDISKIEAGKLELVPEYFSLSDMLDGIGTIFSGMFAQKGLTFEADTDPALPDVVYGDERRIRQILSNILNNAMKYTDTGGARLTVSVETGSVIRFDIADTGIGIREEDTPRLFRAFEQADLVRNKNIIGTGLGLAITDSLCRIMNGSITARSTYGEGSVFTVRLPLTPGTEADLPEAEAEAAAFSAKGARVLLVDDIDINLQVAAFMLEAFDIVPDTATNGATAVAMAAGTKYDLILMDHMMPVMDGIEAAERIRAAGVTAPIVALTANATTEAIHMFEQNGFDGFLAKPVNAGLLAKCLLELLPPALIEPKSRP